jgi:hypothetical protein
MVHIYDTRRKHSYFIYLKCTVFKIVLDSVAALARKEGLNEMDKEQFIIRQVLGPIFRLVD